MLFTLQVAAGVAASLGAVVANPVPVPIASPLPRSCTPSFQDYYNVAIRHSPSGNFWSVESAGLGAGSTVTTKPEANTTFQFTTAPGPNKAQQIIRLGNAGTYDLVVVPGGDKRVKLQASYLDSAKEPVWWLLCDSCPRDDSDTSSYIYGRGCTLWDPETGDYAQFQSDGSLILDIGVLSYTGDSEVNRRVKYDLVAPPPVFECDGNICS